MLLTAGTRLGSYEILGLLGAGGMGEVYRARDLRLIREVAIKILPGGLACSPDRLTRLEREARTVASLNHPNIVVLHSVEECSGTRFLTMELVEGRTLAALVKPGGLPLPDVLDVAIPLADALVAAHEKNLVHRDLKPANVMVTRDGRLKVLDFGLAKLIGFRPTGPFETKPNLKTAETATTTMDSPVSEEGHVVGTVPYMAPEQIRGQSVDARTDLFSFGILIYELATGRRPFIGETLVDVSSAILRDRPTPITTLRHDLPAELERIIGRCLEKQPRARFQTALDVTNELRALRRTFQREAEPVLKPAEDQVASIAVLPFVNRSASADDEYFSDGLADELLNVLAKIRGLRVAARTSAFQFKGRNEDMAVIGQKLHVATLLEGSVRKAGNRVRISVQLVKVSDGYHLWSETYDRTLDDIFAVQDDIAHSVVKELRRTLLGEESESAASAETRAEVARAARGRATHPEAHRLFLLARHLLEQSTRATTAHAIEYLKQALDLDPRFGLARAELGKAYWRQADFGWTSIAEGYGRARESIEQALALEPDLPEAHTEMGYIQLAHDWDWSGADLSLRRALELAPANAMALRRAGLLAGAQGRLDEWIGLCRRALEQDPLSNASYLNLVGSLRAADRHVEAEEACRMALELAPQANFTHYMLALTLLSQGRGEEALAEASAESERALRLYALAIVQHVQGLRQESDETLGQLVESCADSWAYQIAAVYAMRGESDAAFEWLERAYDQRDPGLREIMVNPELRPLHGDQRWVAFLKRMNLPD